VKFLTIDFTGFRPKPLVTQVGVLNFQRCKRNFKCKNILSYLQSKNNALYNKVKLLQENDLLEDTLRENIFNGGLLDDWNYTF